MKCPTVIGDVCNELCQNAIVSLKGEDGKPLYTLDRVFTNVTIDTWVKEDDSMLQLVRKEYPLYKLGSQYTPF